MMSIRHEKWNSNNIKNNEYHNDSDINFQNNNYTNNSNNTIIIRITKIRLFEKKKNNIIYNDNNNSRI